MICPTRMACDTVFLLMIFLPVRGVWGIPIHRHIRQRKLRESVTEFLLFICGRSFYCDNITLWTCNNKWRSRDIKRVIVSKNTSGVLRPPTKSASTRGRLRSAARATASAMESGPISTGIIPIIGVCSRFSRCVLPVTEFFWECFFETGSLLYTL